MKLRSSMSALKRLGLTEVSEIRDISANQKQTDEAFGFKWSKRDTYESSERQHELKRWLLERYCASNQNKLAKWLDGDRKIILDAGCGAGMAALLFFGDLLRDHDYLGVDISNAVEVARRRFLEKDMPGDFMRANISCLGIPDNSIDIIFSEGVLHHTDSTEKSLKYLTGKLVSGGLFMFYVYRKKALVREFTDDAIRESIRSLTDEQAWEALKPLTQLGIALGKITEEINIENPIPYLGIEAGMMDLQRFFYWNICKTFYRPELTFDEMNHINFDWFRPLNCQRHTPQEIMQWCGEANLEIEHLDLQEAGITVVARKK